MMRCPDAGRQTPPELPKWVVSALPVAASRTPPMTICSRARIMLEWKSQCMVRWIYVSSLPLNTVTPGRTRALGKSIGSQTRICSMYTLRHQVSQVCIWYEYRNHTLPCAHMNDIALPPHDVCLAGFCFGYASFARVDTRFNLAQRRVTSRCFL